VSVRGLTRQATLKHTVTRYRITLDCFTAQYVSGDAPAGRHHWLRPEQLADYPLCTTGRKIARSLKKKEDSSHG
jgi:hypothetical protein